MTDIDGKTLTPLPSQDLITLTHVMYALHAFSALAGITTAAFVVTAFLTGWPSIIAVIINYVKRDAVRGTFLDSHFSWQLRTFWWSLLWVLIAVLIGALLAIIIVGFVAAYVMIVLVGLWVIYRIIRGWIALANREAMPQPG
ncbi:MAG: hypothetical protein K2X06_01120 [Burkholderiales bacterium]|nr:hypothetical protein [Burkholderiales bacterium]